MQDADLVLWQRHLGVLRGGRVEVGAIVLLELGVTHADGGFKVLGLDARADLFSQANGLHQRRALDLVLADGDDGRRRRGRGVKNGFDGLNTLQGRQPTVVGTGRATALGVAQHGDAGVEAQARAEDLLDVVRRNLLQVAILRALGHNDNGSSLAALFAVLMSSMVSILITPQNSRSRKAREIPW